MKINAVILAGAPAGDFEDEVPLTSRAMVPLNGVTLLDRVAEALYNNENISGICAVGHVVTDFADTILEPEDTLVGNISKAHKEFVTGDYVLLCTSDIPLIDSEIVTDFITQALQKDADFVYPICRREVCSELYPDLRRTYVKLADGEFTGGNIMLIKSDYLSKLLPVMSRLYEYRKSPLKLARLMGFNIIFRLLLSRLNSSFLDISTIENKASELLGGGVLKAVITSHPEICEDLDSPDEVVLYEKILKDRTDNL